MIKIDTSVFKAYDIRGIYPDQIDEDIVYRIAQAYVKIIKPKGAVVLGKDVRISSPSLWKSAAQGLIDMGVDVIDIGTVSTDMLYFAVAEYGHGGGITISASHNPKEYNGMKLVRERAIPISGDSGIVEIKDEVLKAERKEEEKKGKIIKKDIWDDYIEFCLSFIDKKKIKPFKIVANPNFGMAGKVLEKISKSIPIEIVPLNFEPDGSFPKGRPDPLIPENRDETIALIKESSADLGVAWDADADRFYFFDENGEFVDGYFVTAILSEIILEKHPGAKIISDPRQIWAIQEIVNKNGGTLILNKAGHSFIKERMIKEDAVFAGEMSGHYYFKYPNDTYYDNGMIPFFIVLEKLSVGDKKLSQLSKDYRETYFISGEINSEVADPIEIINEVENKYKDGRIEHIDGLSVEYSNWRFNLRPSNTESLLRLNVEAKTKDLMEEKRDEILKLIK